MSCDLMRRLKGRVMETEPLWVKSVTEVFIVHSCWALMSQRNRWFLLANSFQIWRMRAKPTVSRSSFWRRARKSPSCQLAALFARRCKTRAPSGPIPPQVPKDMARKPQPGALQGASYFACFSVSFLFRKVRHLSLVTENRSDDCHPWATMRSRAVGQPFWKEVRRISAGRSSPSGQSGIFTSVVKPCPDACSKFAMASCTALCRREKFFRAQHSK